MCLAEQLAETYKTAKTELVQSLSFTLTGVANYTRLLPDMSEHPVLNSHHMDPELNWHVIDNLNTHNYVSKPSIETTLRSFVGKPPGSTNGCDVFIPHAEVADVVEDPDIHTAEDMILAAKRLPNACIENIIEGDASGVIYGSSDDSEDLDNRSDEVHDGDDDEDEDEDDEYDDGGQQQKNQMTHTENTVKTNEEGNVNEKEERVNETLEEDLGKGLNPDASEFKPVVVTEHELLKSHSEGNVEAKTAAGIVPAPVDNSHLIGTASSCNALGKLYAV